MSSPAIPYFERAWKVTLDTQAGDHLLLSSSDFADPLRVTFTIDTYMLLAYWEANLTLYNVNRRTQSALEHTGAFQGSWSLNQPVQLGDTLSISAGYKADFDPQANLIYTGEVFQPVWTRENMVDWKITLRCLKGLMLDANGFVNFSSGPATPFHVVNQITKAANIPVENIDQDALSQKTHPNGRVVHGRPYWQLRQIAKDNNLMAWVSSNGLNMRTFKVTPNTIPDIVYAPSGIRGAPKNAKPTILGVPEQTQKGVVFRVLMDSEPRIGSVVQLAQGTTIARFPVSFGKLPPAPNPQQMYVIAGVRHVGNNRGHGDDWYTEITGVTWDFFPDFLLARNPAKQ